jgi:hypothetical protein
MATARYAARPSPASQMRPARSALRDGRKAAAMETFSRVRSCRSGWAIAGSATCGPPSHALQFWRANIFSNERILMVQHANS